MSICVPCIRAHKHTHLQAYVRPTCTCHCLDLPRWGEEADRGVNGAACIDPCVLQQDDEDWLLWREGGREGGDRIGACSNKSRTKKALHEQSIGGRGVHCERG